MTWGDAVGADNAKIKTSVIQQFIQKKKASGN
jgi:hypothetical protein